MGDIIDILKKLKDETVAEKLRTYDFTEDWEGLYKEKTSDKENEAHNKYKKLPVMKKYFTYKMVNSQEGPKKEYKKAKRFWNSVRNTYSEPAGERYYISDPDTYSPLLQEIYQNLWSGTKGVLECCTETKNKEKIIHGDTMNSIQTTLSWYTRYCYDKNINYYGADLKKGQNNGFVNNKNGNPKKYDGSISQALEIYCWELNDYLTKQGNMKPEEQINCLIDFIKYNHTLGNFIPVPFESGGGNFSGARYKATYDFWDLTLYYIYCWYVKNPSEDDSNDSDEVKVCDCIKNEKLCELLGKNCQNVKLCIKWLKAFGSWDGFVEGNFLQPFVYKYECKSDKAEGVTNEIYGIPKLLWCNDKDYKYPTENLESEEELDKIEKAWEKRINEKNKCESEKVCEQYFENAKTCIEKRTELMIDVIIKKSALKWEKLEKWLKNESQL